MTVHATNPRIGRFRAEYAVGAAVVGSSRPRLSWTVEGAEDWLQQAYELSSDDETIAIESGESLFVPWPFAPLKSRERRAVRVRAASTDGRRTNWSDDLAVEAGLLEASAWQASFVGPQQSFAPEAEAACPLLRREFVIDRPVASARLYMTALGVYDPYLNGAVISDQVLAPNWTSYHNRLRYQVIDVTDSLQDGPNVLGAILGEGWYRGRISRRLLENTTKNSLALLAQLEVTLDDGTTQVVVTDEKWKTQTGPILASCIYDGERYDARLELPGWSEPVFDDGNWQPVTTVDHPLEALIVPPDPPIRRVEEIPVAEVLESPSGKLIVDFGQNLVGRLRIQVAGEAGDMVTIRHAEILKEGELARESLGDAQSEDVYVLKGGGAETWEPHFTFHGFRYAQIDGWPGDFDHTAVRAIVLQTDFERIGWFECSNPLVTRLYENALWSLRGNFLGLLTDCPQRDERLGWTAEAQLSSPSASRLFDVNGSLVSWLADLAAEQTVEGRVPYVIPNILPLTPSELPADDPSTMWTWAQSILLTVAAGWGDAAVIIPWVLYQRFGDSGVLVNQWESMRKWVDYVERLVGASRVWAGPLQFGDWLDPSAPLDHPHRGQTPPEVFATAYFARSAELVARTAEVLGLEDEARRYSALAAEVRSAFCAAFMDDAGNLEASSATAQALVLAFSLYETDEQRRRAGARLSQIVAATGYRISTGTTGTAIICDALCDAGDLDGAYRLLLQTEFPSWLYPVTMGATTLWERWDGILPDGRINPSEGNSFNHFVFGSIVDWLYRTVAGIEPAEPGYRKIRLRPCPGGDLTHTSARLLTPYGLATISWRVNGHQIEIGAEVPPNTQAEVVLPDGSEPFEVGSGHHDWSVKLESSKEMKVGNTQEGRLFTASETEDLTATEMNADPYAYFGWLRETGPVTGTLFSGIGSLLATAVFSGCSNVITFSSDAPAIIWLPTKTPVTPTRRWLKPIRNWLGNKGGSFESTDLPSSRSSRRLGDAPDDSYSSLVHAKGR